MKWIIRRVCSERQSTNASTLGAITRRGKGTPARSAVLNTGEGPTSQATLNTCSLLRSQRFSSWCSPQQGARPVRYNTSGLRTRSTFCPVSPRPPSTSTSLSFTEVEGNDTGRPQSHSSLPFTTPTSLPCRVLRPHRFSPRCSPQQELRQPRCLRQHRLQHH